MASRTTRVMAAATSIGTILGAFAAGTWRGTRVDDEIRASRLTLVAANGEAVLRIAGAKDSVVMESGGTEFRCVGGTHYSHGPGGVRPGAKRWTFSADDAATSMQVVDNAAGTTWRVREYDQKAGMSVGVSRDGDDREAGWRLVVEDRQVVMDAVGRVLELGLRCTDTLAELRSGPRPGTRAVVHTRASGVSGVCVEMGAAYAGVRGTRSLVEAIATRPGDVPVAAYIRFGSGEPLTDRGMTTVHAASGAGGNIAVLGCRGDERTLLRVATGSAWVAHGLPSGNRIRIRAAGAGGPRADFGSESGNGVLDLSTPQGRVVAEGGLSTGRIEVKHGALGAEARSAAAGLSVSITGPRTSRLGLSLQPDGSVNHTNRRRDGRGGKPTERR